MQYWLKNHSPGSVKALSQQCMTKTLPASVHTNHISYLSNNYVSLLSDLCTCVQVRKMVSQMKSYSSSVTGLTGTLLSVAVLHKNHHERAMEFFFWLAHIRRRRRKKEKHFDHLATFRFGTFVMLFCATGGMVQLRPHQPPSLPLPLMFFLQPLSPYTLCSPRVARINIQWRLTIGKTIAYQVIKVSKKVKVELCCHITYITIVVLVMWKSLKHSGVHKPPSPPSLPDLHWRRWLPKSTICVLAMLERIWLLCS